MQVPYHWRTKLFFDRLPLNPGINIDAALRCWLSLPLIISSGNFVFLYMTEKMIKRRAIELATTHSPKHKRIVAIKNKMIHFFQTIKASPSSSLIRVLTMKYKHCLFYVITIIISKSEYFTKKPHILNS